MSLFDLVRHDDFDLFDDVFGTPLYNEPSIMKTDMRDLGDAYEMEIETPGVDKKDIKLSLYNGNLNVEAHYNHNKEEKDEHGNVVHQERYSGHFARSYFVGEDIKENDIHVKFENGLLTLQIPKQERLDNNQVKYIEIQ